MTLPEQLRAIADRLEAANLERDAALNELARMGHYVTAVLDASPDSAPVPSVAGEERVPAEAVRAQPASPAAPIEQAGAVRVKRTPAHQAGDAGSTPAPRSTSCPECGHAAKNASGLAIHIGRAHKKPPLIVDGDPTEPNGHDFNVQPKPVGIEWFLCNACPAKYTSRLRRDQHVARTHTEREPRRKPVGSQHGVMHGEVAHVLHPGVRS